MNYDGGLAYFPKITYKRFKRLRTTFASAEEIWNAEFTELVGAGLEEAIAHEFIAWRETVRIEKITQELAFMGITTLPIGEPGYPRLLAEIADPPHTLFVRGTVPPDTLPSIAVVGTRRCSPYGRAVTEQLVNELVAAGVVIVSGLALGIDGIAHEAVVNAHGLTVAVLGSGIDPATISPASHRLLAEKIIAAGGAIISEYPPGFTGTNYTFPARNRIIAGLTLGTLVTEAPKESGALITAKCALDYNREVFAVPHPITALSGEGGNSLIQQGALLTSNAEIILQTCNLEQAEKPVHLTDVTAATPSEAALLPHLNREPRHIDALIRLSGLSSAETNSALVMLEVAGAIKNLGGMMYVRR